CGQASHLPLTF
nr:immunoglobulin light chain junction region [Macaca mulatta]